MVTLAYGYADNIFTAIIDENGTIYEASTGRKRQAVGIDSQKEQEYQQTISEMQERLDNYYAKLVEVGIIVPPKTPEEIAQEAALKQQETMSQMLTTMQAMQDEIRELKDNGSGGRSTKSGIDEDEQDSGSDRKKPGRRKKSDTTGPEDIVTE